jgi:hypothetical protein
MYIIALACKKRNVNMVLRDTKYYLNNQKLRNSRSIWKSKFVKEMKKVEGQQIFEVDKTIVYDIVEVGDKKIYRKLQVVEDDCACPKESPSCETLQGKQDVWFTQTFGCASA